MPARTLGTLVVGLGDKTRIGQKISGVKASADTILIAKIYDMCQLLLWAQTTDAGKGKNRPKMLSDELINAEKELQATSIEDLEEQRRRILGE